MTVAPAPATGFVNSALAFLQSVNYATLITGFIGAIMGACIAYLSDWLKQNRKKHYERRGAINRGQMTLISQLNTIQNILDQYLDPKRTDAQRPFNLIYFSMQDVGLRLDFDSLAFLLTSKNGGNLMLDLLNAEHCYLTAMSALSARNDAYNRIHSSSKIQQIDHESGRCIVELKDPRDLKLLTDLTNILYDTMDRAKANLEARIEALYLAAKALYPRKKFIKTEDKDAQITAPKA